MAKTLTLLVPDKPKAWLLLLALGFLILLAGKFVQNDVGYGLVFYICNGLTIYPAKAGQPPQRMDDPELCSHFCLCAIPMAKWNGLDS